MARRLTVDLLLDDGIRFVEFRELKEQGIPNLMTTRDYDTGAESCGDPLRLAAQYRHMLKILRAADSDFWLLEQVHSDRSLLLEDSAQGEPYAGGRFLRAADGLITGRQGVSLAIAVADCIPLVIFDPMHRVLANIHSGWRGTLGRIGGKSLQKMTQAFGTRPQDVRIFMGPHIGPSDFQVRQDVQSAFVREFGEELQNLPDPRYIKPYGSEHWTIYLAAVVEAMFLNLGVSADNIYVSPDSTFARNDLYHSHRRDGQHYGAMSLVVVNSGAD